MVWDGAVWFGLVLPVNKLDRRHHVIPIRSNSVSEDGGEAVSMMAFAVILAERDCGAVHRVLILHEVLFSMRNMGLYTKRTLHDLQEEAATMLCIPDFKHSSRAYSTPQY